MPQSKEVHKEYMRKLRGSQKGSQIKGSQPEGSQDRIAFIQSQLAPWTVDGIEQASSKFDDRELRYERAYVYKLKREGNYPHDSILGMSALELREATQ